MDTIKGKLAQRSILTATLVAFIASSGYAFASPQTPKSTMAYQVLHVTEKIIDPSQITRPSGPFLLVIKNHSRLKKLVIHLKEHAGATDVIQASLDEENGNYAAVVDLPPATYDLSEPGHPSLKCTLTITK